MMMARRLILSDAMVMGHDDGDDANEHRDDDVDSIITMLIILMRVMKEDINNDNAKSDEMTV